MLFNNQHLSVADHVRSLIITVELGLILCTKNAQSLQDNTLAAYQSLKATSTYCAVSSPSPRNYVCYERGYVHPLAPYPIDYFAVNQTTTWETCRNLYTERTADPQVFAERACQSFSFDTLTNRCALYKEPLHGTVSPGVYSLAFRKNHSSSVIFSSAHCYPCAVTCPIEQTYNLLGNGGFELSQNYIGPWGPADENGGDATQGKIISDSRDSGNAFFCSQGPCQLSQFRNLCHGQVYLLSADVKIVNTTLRKSTQYLAKLAIQIGDLTFQTGSQAPSIGQWHTIKVSFAFRNAYVLDLDELLFSFGLDQGSADAGYDYYLDNTVMQKAPETFSTRARSLLRNGGFETGELQPWAYESIYPAMKEPNETYGVIKHGLSEGSQFSFRYSALEGKVGHYYDYPIYASGFRLMQNVTLKPFHPYLFSMQYKTNATRLFAASVGDNEWLTTTYPQLHNKSTVLKRVFTPVQRQQVVTLEFRADNSYDDYRNDYDPTQQVFVDNIMLLELSGV